MVDLPTSEFTGQAGEASRLLKALSNESRLLVLCFLVDAGELSVGELTERVGLSQSALSQHLAKLREERSEEHTSELQSLMRISYAVFCLKKNKNTQHTTETRIKLLPNCNRPT